MSRLSEMSRRWTNRVLLLAAMGGLIAGIFALGLHEWLTLVSLKAHLHDLVRLRELHPVGAAAIYAAAYVLLTALSIPGAVIASLAGGALFGLWQGVLLASFSAALGATISMLGSRYLLRDVVRRRFPKRIAQADRGVAGEGWIYLASLRLVPLMPYFLVNLVFGVIALPVWQFYVVSQVFMLPAAIIYVNAGTQVEHLGSLSDILSPSVFVSLMLLAALPVASRRVLGLLKAQP